MKPIKMINTPKRPRVPIHIASLGPKSVEICAASADGWLPFLFVPSRSDRVWGESLRRGLARRPADLGPLQITAGGLLAIGTTTAEVAHLRDKARPQLALYIGGMGAKGKNFYHALATSYGYGAEADRIQELYLAGEKEAAAKAVPDDLVRDVSLIGSAGFVKERIAAFREAGVTTLNVVPIAATKNAWREIRR